MQMSSELLGVRFRSQLDAVVQRPPEALLQLIVHPGVLIADGANSNEANSEVVNFGSVDVAVTAVPGGCAFSNVARKWARPLAPVVTSLVPLSCSPCG